MPGSPDRAPRPSPASGVPTAFAVLLPFLVAVAVGIPSVRGTFIRDDWHYVAGNPHVVCRASLSDVFSSPFQPLESLGLYRPVTTLSLRFDAWLGWEVLGLPENAPETFHATNLLLSGLAAAFVALLFLRLVRTTGGGDAGARAALAAGLVFAAHPARTEAVCWISARAEGLMAAFALLALVLAAGPPSRVRTALSAACAVLAALSKEQGFAVAAIVPFVAPPPARHAIVRSVAVAAALALAFALRWWVMGRVTLLPGMPAFEGLSPAQRGVQGLVLLAEYARVAVWPHPLLFEYDARTLRAAGMADLRAVAGAAVLVALLVLLARVRRHPLPAAAAALFLFPLLPVLNVFVPIAEDFAERFLTLPVAGLALAAGAVAARFPAAGFGAVMAAVAALGAVSAMHAADYRSERVLYEALLARTPASPPAKTLLASSLMAPGDRQPSEAEMGRALVLLREAIAADPGYHPARTILARYESERRAALRVPPLPADVQFLRDTIERFPRLPGLHGMLGVALYQRRAPDLARAELEQELASMPFDTSAANHLARILREQNDHERARKVIADVQARWEAVWRRFPGFANVAITYSRTLSEEARDIEGARDVLRRARAAACQPSDRMRIEGALAAIGGR